MSFSAKKVVSNIFSITCLAAAIAATHFFFMKPAVEEAAFKMQSSAESMSLYKAAREGDQKAFERLEQMTHEGSLMSYVLLDSMYTKQAIKDAGIDMNSPNPNLESVDLSKSSNLILQAVRELDDQDLLFLLNASDERFDPERQAKLLADAPDERPAVKNSNKLDTLSTFDQPTKDKLLACNKKLKEKFPNDFYKLLYMRSHGACLDHPIEFTPISYFKMAAELISPTIAVKVEDVK
jgi:hypothetical protein